jgi:hypothetical protein
MTISNGYATLAEFQSYMTSRGGAPGTDSSDDAVIEDTIEATSRLIDQVTNRRFYTTTNDETRYYTPECDSILFIDDLSAAPTSIKTDTTYDRTYATTVGSSDYDLEPFNALLKGVPYTWIEIAPHASAYFPEAKKSVQIVGKFGFASVPEDIKGVCLATALNMYQSRTGQSSPGNVTVTAVGVVIRPQDIPSWGMVILNKYKRII